MIVIQINYVGLHYTMKIYLYDTIVKYFLD